MNNRFVPVFCNHPVPATVDEIGPSNTRSPAPATDTLGALVYRTKSPKPDGLKFPTDVFAVSCNGPDNVDTALKLKFTNAPNVFPYPFPATPVPPIHTVSAVERPFKSSAAPAATTVPAAPPVAPNAPALPNRKIPAFTLINPVRVDVLSAPNVNVFSESLMNPGLAESEIVPFKTMSP
jgi:hypothetical protein